MMIVKQMDVRSNIKKYFDIAYGGEPVIVPRKQDKNVVIISEDEYNRLKQAIHVTSYATNLKKEHIKQHNLEKLNTIRSFRDNWNGNGAPSFPTELINKVENLILSLSIQPEIFPTALCTIQLEYDNSRRDHMEIEIGLDENAEVFTVLFNGEEKSDLIPATAETINELAESFYG